MAAVSSSTCVTARGVVRRWSSIHQISPEAHGLAGELRSEYVLGIQGTVVGRGSQVNPRMKTGAIEIHAERLEIFNRAEPPPFAIEDEIDTHEEKRLASLPGSASRTAAARADDASSADAHHAQPSTSANGFSGDRDPLHDPQHAGQG